MSEHEHEHEHEHEDQATTDMWRSVLVDDHKDRPSSYLPGGDRCGMCMIPLSGLGGVLMKTLRGRTHSRKNPAMCNL